MPSLPTNTRMDLQLRTNMGTASCCLVLQTNSEAVIKGVMLFAEQVSCPAHCRLQCSPCQHCMLSRGAAIFPFS